MSDPIETVPPPQNRGSLLRGFLIAAGWNAGALLISYALIAMYIGMFLVAAFGLLQFAWLLPMWARYRKAGQTESAKGVLVAAGISFLLSAACWSVLRNSIGT